MSIDWRLFLILTCSIFAIIVLFSWWFIFNRSIWRIILSFIGLLLNLGNRKYADKTPIPPQPDPKKEAFMAELEARKNQPFTPSIATHPPHEDDASRPFSAQSTAEPSPPTDETALPAKRPFLKRSIDID